MSNLMVSEKTPQTSSNFYMCRCGRRKQLIQGTPMCLVCEANKMPDVDRSDR